MFGINWIAWAFILWLPVTLALGVVIGRIIELGQRDAPLNEPRRPVWLRDVRLWEPDDRSTFRRRFEREFWS